MAFDTLGVNDFSEEVFWSVTIFSLKIIIETKLRKTMYLKTFFFLSLTPVKDNVLIYVHLIKRGTQTKLLPEMH